MKTKSSQKITLCIIDDKNEFCLLLRNNENLPCFIESDIETDKKTAVVKAVYQKLGLKIQDPTEEIKEIPNTDNLYILKLWKEKIIYDLMTQYIHAKAFINEEILGIELLPLKEKNIKNIIKQSNSKNFVKNLFKILKYENIFSEKELENINILTGSYLNLDEIQNLNN